MRIRLINSLTSILNEECHNGDIIDVYVLYGKLNKRYGKIRYSPSEIAGAMPNMTYYLRPTGETNQYKLKTYIVVNVTD